METTNYTCEVCDQPTWKTISYTTGNRELLCAICREEHTDMRDTTGIVICEYCAHDRKPEYRPTPYNTREIEFVSVKCPRCPSWLNSYAAQAYHNRHVCN